MEKTNEDLKLIADNLFEYLRDVIYNPANASLDINKLPEAFRDFGKGLVFFSDSVIETTKLANELASGNLNCSLPHFDNELAAPLKMLHASLRHLTWQTQQVASGDYKQRVDFMGDFSLAFNNMIKQLERRRNISLGERSKLQRYIDLLLVNCPDPILIFDKERKLAYVSDSYLKSFDVKNVKDISGKNARELFSPLVTNEFQIIIESMFEMAAVSQAAIEKDIDFEYNGTQRYYQIQVSPMLDENGYGESMLMLLHDITEIMIAQREAKREREIAERSSRAKSDFLARMSHEMRTPMNAIIGMTAIYQATDNDLRRSNCIDKIGGASRHLLGVINDILDMSKIESDKFELSENAFNFGKMIEKIIGVVAFKLDEKQQNLMLDIDPKIPEIIIADEQKLTQIITNLLINAVKFTQNGGNISFKAQKSDGLADECSMKITVKDNGIGISAEQQKSLFKPFEQAHCGVARKFGGTGLGLAISKHFVELMGGNIRIESEIGKGAAFIFEIPIKLVANHALRQPKDNVEGQDENSIFKGKRILVAEDVEINREILDILLEHTGITIDAATDGMEALEKFVSAPEKYDIILMDINMPNMDGYEATRRIRASGITGAKIIPIIAMTANVFKEDIEMCLKCGMNAHLGKPIDPAMLMAHLKEYLL